MLKEGFRTVLVPHSHEIVVNKSRFICHLFPVRTAQEAEACIEAVSKQHYKATHNVPAYVVGADYKYSDDGEPSGTAGAPMLSMLRGEGYNNIVAVVTRYFGGVLLGKGGLVRAYTDALRCALQSANVSDIRTYEHINLEFDYSYLGSIEHYLASAKIHTAGVEYGANVALSVYVSDSGQEMLNRITDITGGNVLIERMGAVLLTDDYNFYGNVTPDKT